MTIEESVGSGVATAGQAVVFAGGTVVIAILGLAVAGVPFMTAAGVATSVTVLIMVIASITLLPAFLGCAGHSHQRRLSASHGAHARSHRRLRRSAPAGNDGARHVSSARMAVRDRRDRPPAWP